LKFKTLYILLLKNKYNQLKIERKSFKFINHMSMNDNRVCVVSLIGKSQLLQNQTKAWKLNVLLKQNFFQVTNINIDFFSNLIH
jgi:hypothetical protein